MLGEQQIGELGLPVGFPRVVAAFTGQVVELDADLGRGQVRATAHHHDPALIGELGEQLGDEQEVTDVVRE